MLSFVFLNYCVWLFVRCIGFKFFSHFVSFDSMFHHVVCSVFTLFRPVAFGFNLVDSVEQGILYLRDWSKRREPLC